MNIKLAQLMTSKAGWTPEAVNSLMTELRDNFKGWNDHTHVEICAFPEVTVRRGFGKQPECLALETWDVYAFSANFAYVRGTDILFVHLPH